MTETTFSKLMERLDALTLYAKDVSEKNAKVQRSADYVEQYKSRIAEESNKALSAAFANEAAQIRKTAEELERSRRPDDDAFTADLLQTISLVKTPGAEKWDATLQSSLIRRHEGNLGALRVLIPVLQESKLWIALAAAKISAYKLESAEAFPDELRKLADALENDSSDKVRAIAEFRAPSSKYADAMGIDMPETSPEAYDFQMRAAMGLPLVDEM